MAVTRPPSYNSLKCCHCPDNVTVALAAAAEAPVAKVDGPGVELRVLGGTPVAAGGKIREHAIVDTPLKDIADTNIVWVGTTAL